MVNEKIEVIKKIIEELQVECDVQCQICEFYQLVDSNPNIGYTCVLGDIENELMRLD